MSTKLHLSEHLPIIDNTIPWLTLFFNGGGGGGGVKVLWYNILTPPPLHKIIKNGILLKESSNNLASLHKTFTYH